jgi:site-specific DNA-cytosine methylase
VTWPRSGSMRRGMCSAQATWALRTAGSDSSSWPTATAQSYGTQKGLNPGAQYRPSLASLVKRDWPTPNSAKAGNDVTLTCSGDGRERPNKLGWAVAVEPMAALIPLGSTWSTPTVNAAQNATAGPSQRSRNTPGLAAEADASAVAPLNPAWVATLMGFPDDWTITSGPPAAVKRSTPASPRARRRVSRSEPQG